MIKLLKYRINLSNIIGLSKKTLKDVYSVTNEVKSPVLMRFLDSSLLFVAIRMVFLKDYTKVILLSLLLPLFLSSCVCIPEIETPKIIVPTEFANVLFVNAVWGSSDYMISTEYGKILDDFKFGESLEKKVASGLNNLKLLNKIDSSILYNGFVSLTKDLHYTFILYGLSNRLQALLLPDTISNYIPKNVYIRCVHICNNIPSVIFNIKGAYNVPINCRYREDSEFIALPSGKFTLEIINNETSSNIITMNDVQLNSEKRYYLLLRGIFTNNNYEKVSSQLIEF